MNEKKEMLVSLVAEHNVSAIITMSEKLKIEPEEVVELVNELLSEGKLQGTITEDGSRFFRSNVKVSDAPIIEREEKLPEFLTYDTRPGYTISILGAIVLVGGALVSRFASDITEQDFGAGLFMIGLFILFGGLYLLSKSKTPD